MMRTWISTAVATVLLSSTANAEPPALSDEQAAEVVAQFCETLISGIASYDPNESDNWPPDDPTVFGPLVTQDLASLIEEAQDRSNKLGEATDEKPPLGDGVPWKGVQDAAGACAAGPVSGSPEHPEVEIHYKYADAPDMGWTDTLVLARSMDEWRIDNIRYGESDDDLRSVLVEAFAEDSP